MHTAFTKQDWAEFRANDRPGPIHMLNLVRFRAAALYEDGREATGREAYAAYSRLSAPVFRRVGGRIAWRGDFEQELIGPAGEHWDLCFVAEYPGVAAFVEMVRDPDYQAAMAHRQAGVADSRLIRTRPGPDGAAFMDPGDGD